MTNVKSKGNKNKKKKMEKKMKECTDTKCVRNGLALPLFSTQQAVDK